MLSFSVPMSVPHQALDDVILCGYDIPKGSILLTNLYSASFDAKYWDKPYQFNPDRFLDASLKIKKTDALIPFSAGMFYHYAFNNSWS